MPLGFEEYDATMGEGSHSLGIKFILTTLHPFMQVVKRFLLRTLNGPRQWQLTAYAIFLVTHYRIASVHLGEKVRLALDI